MSGETTSWLDFVCTKANEVARKGRHLHPGARDAFRVWFNTAFEAADRGDGGEVARLLGVIDEELRSQRLWEAHKRGKVENPDA